MTRHYNFAKKLETAGYRATIFCASEQHNLNFSVIKDDSNYLELKEHGVSFVYLKTGEYRGNGMQRIKGMYRFYAQLMNNYKEFITLYSLPDVIIGSSAHPMAALAGIRLSKAIGCKNIVEVRDLWPEAIFEYRPHLKTTLLGDLLVRGERWIYKNADAIIFTKEGDVDYMREKKWNIESGGDISLSKCYYINNGVDIEEFDKSMACNSFIDEHLENGKFNVIYTGAVRDINNVQRIVGAAKLVKSTYPEIQFLIYGDGNRLEELRDIVAKENIFNVILKGMIEKKYIPYVLSKASITLLNYGQSTYNWSRGNSSNKLFEYMAAGKPIISTVEMGYCLINRYNCGVSLPKDTDIELADTVCNFYNMPQSERDRLGKNARIAARNFDFNILSQKLIQVIEEVCK